MKNGYRKVMVLGAGNGTNWFLTANSTNLLNSIGIFHKGETIPITTTSYSGVVHFNTTRFIIKLINKEVN